MSTEAYLILIIIAIILISIALIKTFLKYFNILYSFTKKDLLLFSVFSLYLLFSFIVSSVITISSIENKDICPRPAYENNKLYNEWNRMSPSQDNFVGRFEVASRKSVAVDKAFAVITSILLIIMIIVVFVPIFIILLMEHFLLMLAIFNSKNVFFIKYFLHFDFLLKKIVFNLYYKNYPLKERMFIVKNSNVINANMEYEKAKKEIELYEKSMDLITKNNTSLMYKNAASMLFLIIISFFVINLIFIGYDLWNTLLTKNILSLSVLLSSVLFIFILNKMFSFLIKHKEEHVIEFFQQRSRGDKLFLICIIFVISINHLFLSLSFVELFGILYIMSYLFDLAYNKIIYKNI